MQTRQRFCIYITRNTILKLLQKSTQYTVQYTSDQLFVCKSFRVGPLFASVTREHGVRYRGVQGVHGPPRIKLGGPVVGLDPPDLFLKILKFYVKIKELIIVLKIAVQQSRSQNIYLNLAKIVFIYMYSESFYFFIYSEFLNILTCIFS